MSFNLADDLCQSWSFNISKSASSHLWWRGNKQPLSTRTTIFILNAGSMRICVKSWLTSGNQAITSPASALQTWEDWLWRDFWLRCKWTWSPVEHVITVPSSLVLHVTQKWEDMWRDQLMPFSVVPDIHGQANNGTRQTAASPRSAFYHRALNAQQTLIACLHGRNHWRSKTAPMQTLWDHSWYNNRYPNMVQLSAAGAESSRAPFCILDQCFFRIRSSRSG